MNAPLTTRVQQLVYLTDFGTACFGGVGNLASCPLPREHVRFHDYWRKFEANDAILGSTKHWWWRSTIVGTDREVGNKAADVVMDEHSCLWNATKLVWFLTHAVGARGLVIYLGTSSARALSHARNLLVHARPWLPCRRSFSEVAFARA